MGKVTVWMLLTSEESERERKRKTVASLRDPKLVVKLQDALEWTQAGVASVFGDVGKRIQGESHRKVGSEWKMKVSAVPSSRGATCRKPPVQMLRRRNSSPQSSVSPPHAERVLSICSKMV